MALVAAGLVAWLALRGPEEQRPVAVAEPSQPARRASLQAPVAAPVPRRPVVVEPAVAPAPAHVPTADPVLTALSTTKLGTALVLEVSALLHVPVGRLAVDCFRHHLSSENPLQKLRDRTNVDALRDVDRVALMDEGLVLSGHFAGARWDRLFDEVEATPYGTRSTYFEPRERIDAKGRRYKPTSERYASVGDGLLFIGNTEKQTHHTVDVIEGREPAPAPLLTSAQAYGELYGILAGKVVANMVPREQGELREVVREVVDNVEVHVDASRDVRITVDIQLLDVARTDELAAFIEAGLVMSRQKVRKAGPPLVATLLERTRLVRDGGPLRLETDVPLETLERDLAYCREQVAVPPQASVR
jgi:hypothetical protein